MKQSLEKQPIRKRGITRTLDFAEVHPRCIFAVIAVRVLGIQRLNWLHLREQNNLAEGTKKNVNGVRRIVDFSCRQDELRNFPSRVGQSVIGLRCSEDIDWRSV